MSERPKIKHIAIVNRDPEKLAKFYCDVFDMEIQHRTPSGAVYLTDGYLCVALLKIPNKDVPDGINHFGFVVDDTEETSAKMVAAGAEAPVMKPDDRPYAEFGARDPAGNPFDLSEHGYEMADPGAASTRQKENVDA